MKAAGPHGLVSSTRNSSLVIAPPCGSRTKGPSRARPLTFSGASAAAITAGAGAHGVPDEERRLAELVDESEDVAGEGDIVVRS